MKQVKITYKEPCIFLFIFLIIFGYLGAEMGLVNLLNTIMNTAYALLMDTVFYIMAISVIAGALGSVLIEFGVIALIHRMLSRFMEPVFNLPGASIMGVMTTFLSDNPAILTLAKDPSFVSYFKPFQLPALTNLGTGFGMGLIIMTYMMSLNEAFIVPAIIGVIGATIGSIISVRIMLSFTKKMKWEEDTITFETNHENTRMIRDGSVANRLMTALLDGGQQGVQLGFDIIPGVLIICTFVMLLTNSAPVSGYTVAAYEGVGLLPQLGQYLEFILTPLFGFSSSASISVPITALGSAGAAMSLVPTLHASPNDIAVFTAMCMCFSGYLSTHVAMMSVLGFPHLTGKSIISHTVGGICAGISAHFIYLLISLI